jgi:hypothetical protein
MRRGLLRPRSGDHLGALDVLRERKLLLGRCLLVVEVALALLGVVDIVHPIELDDVVRARRLVARSDSLSARDAVHVAIMQRREIGRILTFDEGFDGIAGIERIQP